MTRAVLDPELKRQILEDNLPIGRPHYIFGRAFEWFLALCSIAVGGWIFTLVAIIHFDLPSTLKLPGWLWPFLLLTVGSARCVVIYRDNVRLRRLFACLAMCAWAFAGEALIARKFYGLTPPMCFSMIAGNFTVYWLLKA